MSDKIDNKDLDNKLLARMLQDFLVEAPEHLDQLNLNLIQLEEDPGDESLIDVIFRIVHSLKGSAAFVGLTKISEISRKMEDIFGLARSGTFNIVPSTIDVMYEGVDLMTALVDKATANDSSGVDVSPLLQKLEGIRKSTIMQFEEKDDKEELEPFDSQELLIIFMKSYDQLTVLKHIVYSSVHLSDLESLAVLLSKQIDERMSAQRNAVWLVKDHQNVAEVARNGNLIKEEKRRVLEIDSSKVLKRAIREQLVIWPSSLEGVKEMLPEFQSPVLFPVKAQPEAFGFIVLDPEESAEMEVYQFVCHFAAMIFNISKLHQQIERQRKELNEMTEILFKQNERLSSLYHVELDLMKANNLVDLCRIVVETVVSELEARRAAAFLINESSQELIGISGSGGFQGIDSIKLAIDTQKAIKQAIESGRVVSYRDYPEGIQLGPYLLEKWVVLCFKGRERVQGVLVAELEDEDVSDSISILANHASTLLDNIILQKKVEARTEDA